MTAAADSTPLKTCAKCGECKPFTSAFFPTDGAYLRRACKKCRAADKARNMAEREAKFPEKREKRASDVRAYSAANKQKIQQYKRVYATENSASIKQYSLEYYKINADAAKERAKIWRAGNPDRRLENNRRWARENPEKSADCSRRNKARRMQNPVTAFVERVRSLVAASIRNRGYTKRSKSHEILGCDWGFFKEHIERQFLKGMAWDKMGCEIHIDHVVPLATAATEADVIALNHYTNLRPMWAKDNLQKSDKRTHLI